ncbi:FtsQ-type POTRA domain-containing protein [Candidatus Gracilibacteria bacterium]|nr:FtsQ-type POTRA domain-containing protein [Candidatus Gracilibacteria bacterium]MCF7819417.1 FtsQ-type POTRA domain-containing protein [Candidatus Gracilibacteria bacterium]
MFRKKSRHRREFLLDSHQKDSRRSRKWRNKTLYVLSRILLLRHITRLFRTSFLLGTALILMTLFIFFAVFSPYFDLKKITVQRDNPNINVSSIEETLSDFYGRNLLFFSREEVRQTLGESFPEFRDIQIEEDWPSEMILKISVSPPLFNLLNTHTANFSVISEDGVILQQESQEELPVLKVFQHEKPILVRQKFLTREELEKIRQAEKLLQEEFELPLHASHLYWASQELHLISTADMELWIDLAQPIEPQMQKLNFSADEIGLYTRRFDHIDLRIPQQIFWEYR